MKHRIVVTVSGTPGSGKTVVQRIIAETLSRQFTNVEVEWGIDGEPQRDANQHDKLVAILSDRPIQIIACPLSRINIE